MNVLGGLGDLEYVESYREGSQWEKEEDITEELSLSYEFECPTAQLQIYDTLSRLWKTSDCLEKIQSVRFTSRAELPNCLVMPVEEFKQFINKI